MVEPWPGIKDRLFLKYKTKPMNNEKLELPAVVELFGHQKMAGMVTEQTIGGGAFVRIDVPETEQQPAFTRLVNPSAIYAINPVTYEVMKSMADRIQNKPIESWDIRQMQEKLMLLAEKNQGSNKESSGDDDDESSDMNFYP